MEIQTVPVYLDCNATTPMEPEVLTSMVHYMQEDFGNAGSRTHEFGARAKAAVQKARIAVANVISCEPDEVIFTSGATESNNIALLGLTKFAEDSKKKHVISSAIEHKAVLEPLEYLSQRGFEITLLNVDGRGRVDPSELSASLRNDTFLVSIMHINNETGIIQPIEEFANILKTHDAYFHVDAAQSFGKEIQALKNKRIDMMSISAHKIYGPKGIGALITRRRKFSNLPIEPIMFGGGQERSIRPGTLPVPLIVGLGVAADLSLRNYKERRAKNEKFQNEALAAANKIGALVNGDINFCTPTTLNISIPGIDSEACMVALKQFISISNGSACTSNSYKPSHVLEAMGYDKLRVSSSVRMSWCHMTEEIDWNKIINIVKNIIN